jgi:hypothetical protein
MPGRWLSRRVDVGSVLASGEWRRPTLSLASGTPVDGAAPPERPVLYDLVAERARALIAAIGTFTPSEAMHNIRLACRASVQLATRRAVRIYAGDRVGLLECLLGAVHPRADRMATPDMWTR